MDFNRIPMFGLMKKRLGWFAQRQEVLAQNISNSDTPGYQARDLKPFRFRELIRRQGMQLNMSTPHPDHAPGLRKRVRDFSLETNQRPFETSPSGNSVILEEQMSKLNENMLGHKMTTQLYKKHLSMIRIAIGKR